jgi:hypothetical protein
MTSCTEERTTSLENENLKKSANPPRLTPYVWQDGKNPWGKMGLFFNYFFTYKRHKYAHLLHLLRLPPHKIYVPISHIVHNPPKFRIIHCDTNIVRGWATLQWHLLYFMFFSHLNSAAHVFTPTLPLSFPDIVTNRCLKWNTALEC